MRQQKDVMLKKWEGTSFEDPTIFKQRADKVRFKYLLMGFEICPTTGKKHIQFYGETVNRMRLSTIGNAKHLNCAVFPLRRPVREAIRYIIDNVEKPNPIYEEIGVRPAEYETNDHQDSKVSQALARKAVNAEILSLARLGKFDIISDKYPGIYLRSYQTLRKIYADSMSKPVKDNIQCIRVIGKSGCGKTQFLKEHFQNDDVYFYNKNPNFYERYNSEQVLVIDDLDKSCRHLLFHLKTTCDTIPNLLNVKFGSMWSNVRKIFITTQYSWKQLIGVNEKNECIDPELEEALTRRFTNFLVTGRDQRTNDLYVIDDDNRQLFPWSLRNYLLQINFI